MSLVSKPSAKVLDALGGSNIMTSGDGLAGKAGTNFKIAQGIANIASMSYPGAAMGGAAIGGIYGAVSGGLSDTDSMLGKAGADAMTGAALGAGARFGARYLADANAGLFASKTKDGKSFYAVTAQGSGTPLNASTLDFLSGMAGGDYAKVATP